MTVADAVPSLPCLQSSYLIARHCVTSKCWTSSSLPKSRTAASVTATKWEFNSSIMADRAPVKGWKNNKIRSSCRKTWEGEIHGMTSTTTMCHLFNNTFLYTVSRFTIDTSTQADTMTANAENDNMSCCWPPHFLLDEYVRDTWNPPCSLFLPSWQRDCEMYLFK